MAVQKKGRFAEIEFGFPKLTLVQTIRIVSFCMLFLGFISLFASAAYDSYVMAFVGLGLTFWGAILLLIAPAKYVKLELLTAASSSQTANLEKMLDLAETSNKGIYLPPRLLKDYNSSLIFIPATSNEALPKREDIPEGNALGTAHGLFLTPPGFALSKLFEKELRKSFTELSLNQLTTQFPKLLEELSITKTASIVVEGERIVFEAGNDIFKDLCIETSKFQRTHEAVGCPFSSAIACALAKTSGKPVLIEKEERSSDGKTTTIKFRTLEG